MSRSEQVRFWHGRHATIPKNFIKGRLLFEEDTGEVFLDFMNYIDGTEVRVQLTDNRKLNISGGTLTGDLYLVGDPTKPLMAATKQYVDDVSDALKNHTRNTDIHVTKKDKASWNNKVDKEEGKGLSTNDFSDDLLEKLNNIHENASKVEYGPELEEGIELGTLTINDQEYKIFAPIVSGYIDGVSFEGNNDVTHYAVCETPSDDTNKTVEVPGFKAEPGSEVLVDFKYENQVDRPTLNVSGTGEFPITYQGESINSRFLSSGCYRFVFNEGEYRIEGAARNKIATADYDGWMSAQDKQTLDFLKHAFIDGDVGEGVYPDITLPPATTERLGAVIVGDNITVDMSGKISITENDIAKALGFDPTEGKATPIDWQTIDRICVKRSE